MCRVSRTVLDDSETVRQAAAQHHRRMVGLGRHAGSHLDRRCAHVLKRCRARTCNSLFNPRAGVNNNLR